MKKNPSFHRIHGASRQRGVVLLFALIALVIMLIAAVALVRSFNTSLYTAGNIGFKRDLQNQSEKAYAQVLTDFQTGLLNNPTARAANQPTRNYSAVVLPTDAAGIPTALQGPLTGADISIDDQSIHIRYVIDRLCNTAGAEATLAGTGACMLSDDPTAPGTSLRNLQSAERSSLCPTCVAAGTKGLIYRLSVKVTGPRGTQSFFQSTFSVPTVIS